MDERGILSGNINESELEDTVQTLPSARKQHEEMGESIRYTSFWELPRLTHISGGIILAFGLANLILILLKIEWSGLLWLFFYSIPANTAISVFPHEPAIVFSGQFYNSVLVAVIAAGGNLAAAWVDYHFFTPVLRLKFTDKYRDKKIYKRTVEWFARSPFLVVAIFALTPLPFYLVKFLVFATGYSMKHYIMAIFVGRLPRFYLLALLGYHLNIPTWMMVTFFSGVFAVYLYFIVKGWLKSRLSNRV